LYTLNADVTICLYGSIWQLSLSCLYLRYVCVCSVASSTSTEPEQSYGSWSVTYMNPGDAATCMLCKLTPDQS